jgi:hypothetical protein
LGIMPRFSDRDLLFVQENNDGCQTGLHQAITLS